jgi:hypothetical protein
MPDGRASITRLYLATACQVRHHAQGSLAEGFGKTLTGSAFIDTRGGWTKTGYSRSASRCTGPHLQEIH